MVIIIQLCWLCCLRFISNKLSFSGHCAPVEQVWLMTNRDKVQSLISTLKLRPLPAHKAVKGGAHSLPCPRDTASHCETHVLARLGCDQGRTAVAQRLHSVPAPDQKWVRREPCLTRSPGLHHQRKPKQTFRPDGRKAQPSPPRCCRSALHEPRSRGPSETMAQSDNPLLQIRRYIGRKLRCR